jgi:hypothetical protein
MEVGDDDILGVLTPEEGGGQLTEREADRLFQSKAECRSYCMSPQ